MMAFLEKLERKAEQWVATMDGQINQPIVNAMTGEVFTHQPDAHENMPTMHVHAAQTVEDDTQKGHPYAEPDQRVSLKDVRLAHQS